MSDSVVKNFVIQDNYEIPFKRCENPICNKLVPEDELEAVERIDPETGDELCELLCCDCQLLLSMVPTIQKNVKMIAGGKLQGLHPNRMDQLSELFNKESVASRLIDSDESAVPWDMRIVIISRDFVGDDGENHFSLARILCTDEEAPLLSAQAELTEGLTHVMTSSLKEFNNEQLSLSKWQFTIYNRGKDAEELFRLLNWKHKRVTGKGIIPEFILDNSEARGGTLKCDRGHHCSGNGRTSYEEARLLVNGPKASIICPECASRFLMFCGQVSTLLSDARADMVSVGTKLLQCRTKGGLEELRKLSPRNTYRCVIENCECSGTHAARIKTFQDGWRFRTMCGTHAMWSWFLSGALLRGRCVVKSVDDMVDDAHNYREKQELARASSILERYGINPKPSPRKREVPKKDSSSEGGSGSGGLRNDSLASQLSKFMSIT